MKTVTLFAVLAFAFALLGCATPPPQPSGFIPDIVSCYAAVHDMKHYTAVVVISGEACLNPKDRQQRQNCVVAAGHMNYSLHTGVLDRFDVCMKRGFVRKEDRDALYPLMKRAVEISNRMERMTR